MIESERGQRIAALFARGFAELDDHAKTAPHEVDELLRSMVSHVRSWRPEALLLTEKPR